jgi:hypothetical protein
MSKLDWEVCVWTSQSKGFRREFATRAEAYLFANTQAHAFCIEIYGPDDYHDVVS